MALNKFNKVLDDYVDTVTPTNTQQDIINSALKSLSSLMPETDCYAQGSYSTETIVKPLSSSQSTTGHAGEYDIDLVIESSKWGTARDALKAVEEALKNSQYSKMPIDATKNTCVRVEYAEQSGGVSFHVDLVPTKILDDGSRVVAHRGDDRWIPSDAKKFTDEFNSLAASRPELRTLSVILKRLRDRQELTSNIKSILVLTLLMMDATPQGSTMGDLIERISNIQSLLGNSGSLPIIPNPVNPGEDLADSIKNTKQAREFFSNLKDSLIKAVAEDDEEELKDIFGPGFSYNASDKNSRPTIQPSELNPRRAYANTRNPYRF